MTSMEYLNTLIMVAVALVVVFVVLKVLRKRRQNELAKILKEKKAMQQKPTPEEPVIKNSGITFNKKSTEPAPVPDYTPSKTSKISIKKRQTTETPGQIDESTFEDLISESMYLNFDVKELWNDTQLSDIFMSELCCRRLDDYLKKENLEQTAFEANMIPEIGGILLGRFTVSNSENYRITLEEFIPIDSVNPNLYTLEFCTDSLVKELGDAIDTHPELSVVGWFHTHPGHGLFLSVPDMTIQMGFFKEPYQVAMEIDSLSRNLDTGFFTQKTNGKMNNSLYEKPKWYSWKSIIDAINQT